MNHVCKCMSHVWILSESGLIIFHSCILFLALICHESCVEMHEPCLNLVRIWNDHSSFLHLFLALICHESCVQMHEPCLNLVRIRFDHSSFLYFISCANLSWITCANAWAMSESCQNLVWSFFVLVFYFLR